jgi:hypothetical protein
LSDFPSLDLEIKIETFFERFFILGGPRGTQQKNLQNLDSKQLEGWARG